MRHSLLITSLLTVLMLAACGDSRRPGPTSTPVELADFCTEFVDSLCDGVARCACSATADADCRADLTATCPTDVLSPDVQARITAGTVTYDAAAAGRMIAQLRAQTTCDNPMVTVGWNIAEVFTFGGTLTGSLAGGASCTPGTSGSPFGSECANGICLDGGSGTPVCWTFAGRGAPCGAGISSVCIDLDATFSSLENPDLLLRCNIADGATTGTCGSRLADGATCSSGQDCASNRCDTGVCVAPLANGATCSSSSDCLSNYCRYTASTSTCTAAGTVALGGACVDASECVSDACAGGLCVPGICSTYSAPAPAPAPAP